MALSGEALPAEHVVRRDAHVRLGNRCELTPQRVEQLAIEPPRGALEPRRVDEMRSADLGHPDREAGMPPDERARGARVVEVDMRKEQVADIRQLEAVLAQSPHERFERRGRATVEE